MKLLDLKKQMRTKRPDFVRTDPQKKKLKVKYRKPRGIHNKIRLNKAGHEKKPSPGYRTPKKIKHYTREGAKRVILFNEEGLNILKKEELPFIAAGVGLKKKIRILEKAQQKGIFIGNIKDIPSFLAKIKEEQQKKKQELTKKQQKKKSAQEEALKKSEEKKEKTEEEKREEQEAEKRKILHKERIKPTKEIVSPKLPSEMRETRIVAGDKK